MELQRITPAPGVALTSIIDPKFKSSRFSLKFISRINFPLIHPQSIAFRVIESSNSHFPDNSALSAALADLYGASVASDTFTSGDNIIFSIGASWINNRFAFDGLDISGGTLAILRDCILSPHTSGGAFSKDNFLIAQREAIDSAVSIINNKRSYAMLKAISLACEGEPAALRPSAEEFAKVTTEQALSAYRELLSTARIEAFYCSAEPDSRIESLLSDICSASHRDYKGDFPFRCISPLKPEPVFRTETMDVQQCKMFMTFKSQSDDIYALKLLSIILGETPVSRFFRVIREQQSLCYYCSCFYDEMKNLLVADCGIEKADSETIFREINAQIEDIGAGNISNEELESALSLLSSSLENVGDSTGSWINWYFQCICHESIYSPEDELKDYRLVTKARLVQAARSLKLDSVFTLTGKEDSPNEQN